MQITFTGTLDELVAFAERVRPGGTNTGPTKDEKAKAKVEKAPTSNKPQTVEPEQQPIASPSTPASTETPMPPASNGALAVLKNAMAALITAKGRDEVTKLLAKYGVEKVSQVKEADAEKMTEEARALAK